MIKGLQKEFPNQVFRGKEFSQPWMLKRLSTGLTELDLALGGGYPAGGLTMLKGKEGIGKNYLMNLCMANQQQLYGAHFAAAVVSTEMPFDKIFARLCGLIIAFSEHEIAELDRRAFEELGISLAEREIDSLRDQIGTFVTVPPGLAEESLQRAIDFFESGEFQVVGVDSFGSLLTKHDDDGDLSDHSKPGGAAKLISDFARRLNSATGMLPSGKPNMTCLIGTNQVRDNMDRANKYSKKTSESGGWAIKHARWVGIELSSSTKLKRKVGKKEVVCGKVIRWYIDKQKAGGHEGASGTYDFYWNEGPDGLVGARRHVQALDMGERYDVIQKSGSFYKYNGKTVQGRDATAAYLLANDLVQEVEEATIVAAGLHPPYMTTWEKKELKEGEEDNGEA